jgi:DNA-binding winged helix-turn-helix (wHTH) protein
VRYRFGEFTLSQRRRCLFHGGVPVPLIPKYFDLLCLLVERRPDALDRRDIFDRVWADVVVSDGALTQAIRTLRRTLGDDPRAPRYIRTVSRHGYQFVFEPVFAEADETSPGPGESDSRASPRATRSNDDEYEALLTRILSDRTQDGLSDDARREAAEQLHVLGTRQALEKLGTRPGHARARALLRDARWDVPVAGAVPLLGAPGAVQSILALIALRARGAARAAGSRLGRAATGGAVAGVVAGVVGGCALMLPAGSPVKFSTVIALAIIGGTAGAFGAAGVGAGLAAAEVLARSRRRLALAICGATSGLLAGLVAQLAVRTVFGSVVGRPPAALGGPVEGFVIGLFAAIGYAWSTHTPAGGGMASPRGPARLRAATATALCCAAAGAALAAAGGKTVSVTLDTVADTYQGSNVGLAPLGRLIGEREIRPMTRTIVSGFEGLLFGFGLALGLTYRPSTPLSGEEERESDPSIHPACP